MVSKPTAQKPSFLLVNSQPLVLNLLAQFLGDHDIQVKTATSFAQALGVLSNEKIDIVITDFIFDELKISKQRFLEVLKLSTKENIGVVVFTSVPDPRLLGIELSEIPRSAAYVISDKASSPKELLEACRLVILGRPLSKFRQHLQSEHALSALSRSQLNVLGMVASGASNTEIAKQRGTTVRAVENLMKRTLLAMKPDAASDTNSRVMAALMYMETLGIKTPTILDANL